MRTKGWSRKAAVIVASLVVCAIAVGLGYFMGNYAMTAISTGRRVAPPPPAVEPVPAAKPAPPSPSQTPPAAASSSPSAQLLTDLDDAEPVAAPPPASEPASPPAAPAAALFRVQLGPFGNRQEAVALSGELLADGYHAYITPDRPYRVQVGAFSRREMAERLAAELKTKAYANVQVIAPAPR